VIRGIIAPARFKFLAVAASRAMKTRHVGPNAPLACHEAPLLGGKFSGYVGFQRPPSFLSNHVLLLLIAVRVSPPEGGEVDEIRTSFWLWGIVIDLSPWSMTLPTYLNHSVEWRQGPKFVVNGCLFGSTERKNRISWLLAGSLPRYQCLLAGQPDRFCVSIMFAGAQPEEPMDKRW